MEVSSKLEKAVTDSEHMKVFEAVALDPKAESRLLLKMDLYLIPLMTILYFLNFLDRSAVGNANVAGLSKDLHLSTSKYQYNIGLMLFYIIYIITEPASNLMVKKVGARWISFLTVCFGVVTISTAFIKNYHQFLAIRSLLGAAEGGAIPGMAFVLSKFYLRHELVFRIGVFLALAPSLAGAFGGLLAGALISGGPIGTVVGWRKIFLVEGIITSGVGLISFFIIPTSPETASFLTHDERELAVHRLAVEQVGIAHGEETTVKGVGRAFASIMTWGCAIGYSFVNVTVQGTTIFLPTIIATLGKFTTVEVQLRSVPPYVVAIIWSIFISYYCMKTKRHGLFIMISITPSIVGYIIFVASKNKAVLYFASFLSYSGAVPNGPIFLAWATTNSAPDTAKTITSAIVPAIGSIGSIAATWAYLPKTAPHYRPGNSLNVGTTVAVFIVAGLLILYTKWENRQREEGKRDWRLEGLNADEAARLGSRHPKFRYLS